MRITSRQFVVLLAMTVLSGACVSTPTHRSSRAATVDELAAGMPQGVRADLVRLREATKTYGDLATAQAAGYPSGIPACVADSTMGGMGRHYFDRASYDDTLRVERPEMLIYEPDKDGGVRLVAVEYVVPFRLWPETSTAPRLFGQEFKRHDGFRYWQLHVWAWKKNPAGLFADWNPQVSCPTTMSGAA
jgi:hypothetical protein